MSSNKSNNSKTTKQIIINQLNIILDQIRIEYHLCQNLYLNKVEFQIQKLFELFQQKFRYYIPKSQTLILSQQLNFEVYVEQLRKLSILDLHQRFEYQLLISWGYSIIHELEILDELLPEFHRKTCNLHVIHEIMKQIQIQIVEKYRRLIPHDEDPNIQTLLAQSTQKAKLELQTTSPSIPS